MTRPPVIRDTDATERGSKRARVVAFIDECRAGNASLPLRRGLPYYNALSRLLFGSTQALPAHRQDLRVLIDGYCDELSRARERELESALQFVQAGPEDDGSELGPLAAKSDHREHGDQRLARLDAFVRDCRQGRARFPFREDGKVDYRALSHAALGAPGLLDSHDASVRKIVLPYVRSYAKDTARKTRITASSDDLVLTASGVPINLSPTHYALLSWNSGRFRRMARGLEELIFPNAHNAPRAWRAVFSRWRRVRTAGDFRGWLSALLATSAVSTSAVNALPVRVLFTLRRESILLPPLGLLADLVRWPFSGTRIHPPDECFTDWERRIGRVAAGGKSRNVCSYLINIGPIERVEKFPLDEFVLGVTRVMQRQGGVQTDRQRRVIAGVLALARSIDEAVAVAGGGDRALPRIEKAARSHGWKGYRDIDPFSLPRTPVVREWAAEFREYVDSRALKAPRSQIGIYSRVLRFFESLDDPPLLRAGDLRSRLLDGPGSLLAWLDREATENTARRYLSALRLFFEWYGRKTDGFQRPLFREDVPPGQRHAKTTKTPVPRMFLREAKQICHDLLSVAWARQDAMPPSLINGPAFERVLRCRVPLAGSGFVSVVTPQLPALLLTLLSLPLRSIQGRLLDSGEADEFVPLLRDGPGALSSRLDWNRNDGPLATPDRREGCIRRMKDASLGKEYFGFWINTNKTQAFRQRLGTDVGFEIPWQNEELLEVLLRLREWQGTHNPVHRLYARDELSEKKLKPSAALARRMPPYAFLFRDTRERVSGTWHEPVAYERISEFFLLVLEEIEMRRRGTPNEVRLVLTRTKGSPPQPIAAVYSLHGLRVAGITAFAEAGVPAPIIAEFLAGHLTVLMTVYYQKFGPATVTEMLNRAISALDHREAAKATGAAHLEGIRTAFVSEAAAALEMAADVTPGLWAIKLDGVCPNGQTRCAEGGRSSDRSRSQPVPGGSRNCALCRFWITGPAFLSGQAISLNATLFRLREQSAALVELHSRLRTVPATDATRNSLEHAVDTVEDGIDATMRTLQARYRLLGASIQLSNTLNDPERAALVSSGGQSELGAALAATSDFRFLDAISRSVEVFPQLDCSAAPLRRNVLVDQLLERDGFEALLFRLPPQLAASAGNAFGKMLADMVGDAGVDDIANGTRSLEELDIGILERGLRKITGTPLQLSRRGALPSRELANSPEREQP